MEQLLGLPEGGAVTDLERLLSATNGSRVPVEQVRLGQAYLESRRLKRAYEESDEQKLDLLFNSTAFEENENTG